MTAAWDTVAILGVGLIGGSIGLGLRQRGLARRIIGIGRRASSLQAARRRGAATETTTDLRRGVAQANLIIVCTPVEQVAAQIHSLRQHCLSDALITDVASTKATIVAAVESVEASARQLGTPLRGQFVGSHPLAGSEKTGVRYADPDLFVDRAAVVTPTPCTPARAVRRATQLWQSLGARVTRMSAQAHDEAVAAISHLPHLVASALAAATPRSQLSLTGGGWRDTTRVAAGDIELWRQILGDNRQQLLPCLDHFLQVLARFRQALIDHDEPELRRLLEAGKEIRDAVGN
ncbi:MAG: prephenate dehydrogenase/arogenate dehydrogenase family protein [Pirellulales bacterium]